MPDLLQAAIQEARELIVDIALDEPDIGDSTWQAAVGTALRAFSDDYPLRKALSLAITTGDTSKDLPADFIRLDLESLVAAIYPMTGSTLNWPQSGQQSKRYHPITQTRDSITLRNRAWNGVFNRETRLEFVYDAATSSVAGKYRMLIHPAATATVTLDLTYWARHQLTDALDTILPEIRHRFIAKLADHGLIGLLRDIAGDRVLYEATKDVQRQVRAIYSRGGRVKRFVGVA